MGARLHLVRRGAVYYWRRRWPTACARVLGRSHISLSLNTADPRVARRRRARLDEIFARLMDALPEPSRITEAQLLGLLKDLYDLFIQDIAREKPDLPKPWQTDPDELQRFQFWNLRQVVEYRAQRSQIGDTQFAEPLLDQALARRGLGCPRESRDYAILRELAAEISVVAGQDYSARYGEGEPADPEKRALLGLTGELPPEVRPMVPPPAEPTSNPSSDVTAGRPTSMPPLSDATARGPAPEEEAPHPRTIADAGVGAARANSPAPPAAHNAARRRQSAGARTPLRPEMRLSEAFEWLCKGTDDNDAIKGDTARRYQNGISMIIAVLGDRPLTDYARHEVLAFRELIARIPHNHGKSPRHPDDVHALIADADREEAARLADVEEDIIAGRISRANAEHARNDALVRRLSVTTVNHHLQAGGRVYKFAEAEGLTLPNPFYRTRYSKKKKREQTHGKNRMLDDRDIQQLFTSPLYSGCKPTRRAQQGGYFIRDPLYWIPLLQAFQGMRLEECAQLETDDIKQFLGQTCLVVHDGGLRQTKSQAGTRVLPLHPFLEQLGFLKRVAQAKAHVNPNTGAPEPYRRIFWELSKDTRGRLGGHHSKRYRTYRDSIGLDSEDKDGHALRGAFNTYLGRQGVRMIELAEMLGHAGPGPTFKNYWYAPDFQAMCEAIGRLDYGLEVRTIDGEPQFLVKQAPASNHTAA